MTLVALDGYALIRKDSNTGRGGVLLYILKLLNFTSLCISSSIWSGNPGVPEYILCEVCHNQSQPIFIAVVYRPPHSPFISNSDFLSKIVTHVHDYSTKIILGDFNADLLSTSADPIFMQKFINDNSLQTVPYGATHHTATSDT